MKTLFGVLITLLFCFGVSFAQVKESPGRPGHAGKINAVAISADGKTAASAGEDGTIRIWDLATGGQLKVMADSPGDEPDDISGTGIINYLAYSPDGKYLAAARDSGVDLWDTSTWELQEFDPRASLVEFIAFSPDSKLLATGTIRSAYQIDIPGSTVQPKVEIWEIDSSESLRTFNNVSAPFQFHPSGKSIALSGEKGIVWIQDLVTEGALARGLAMKQEEDPVSLLAFDRTGSTLFSVTGGGPILPGKVRAWNWSTLKIIPGIEIETDGVLLPMPDGKSIAITQDIFSSVGLTVLDLGTAKPIRAAERTELNVGAPAAISRDGNTIVIAGKNGHDLNVIDTATLKVRKAIKGHTTTVTSVNFSRDGKVLIAGYDDESVIRWNASNGTIDKMIDGPKVISFSAGTGSSLIAPGGKYYLTESSEYDLIDAETGKTSFAGFSETTNINAAFSETSGHVVIAEGAAVRVHEVPSGRLVKRFPLKLARDSRLAVAAISPDGKTVAISTTTLTIRDVVTGAIKKTFLGGSKNLSAMSFSPDGKFLAVAATDTNAADVIRVYSVTSGKLTYKLPMSTLISDANASSFFAFSPDGKILAVKDERDVTINLIDMASGKVTDSIEGGDAFDGESIRIAFSPDGSRLAFGSTKGIRVVDVKTKKLVHKMN